jgi:hypothetical protein
MAGFDRHAWNRRRDLRDSTTRCGVEHEQARDGKRGGKRRDGTGGRNLEARKPHTLLPELDANSWRAIWAGAGRDKGYFTNTPQVSKSRPGYSVQSRRRSARFGQQLLKDRGNGC